MAENVLEILVRLKDQASAGLKNLSGAFDSVSAGASRITDSLFSLQTAIAGIGAGAAVKGILDTSSAFEGFNSALITTQGSSDAAKSAMAWITDFTAKTPYELDQVADGFTRLSAYGLNATNDMAALGNAASALSKPLNAAVEMMADAVTGEFERLKEFGIRAKTAGDQVTFSWMQNGQQMQQTVEKTGAAIETNLIQILESRFAGSMERFSQTWAGMFSNLKDQWTLFQKSIGDAGLFDFLKQELDSTLAKIQEFKANGQLDDWAQKISAAIQGAIGVLKEYAISIGEFIAKNQDMIAKLLEMAPAITAGVIAIAGLSGAITVLKPVIDAASGAFSLMGKAMTAMGFPQTLQMVQLASKDIGVLQAATANLGIALKTAAGLAASFFAGWKLGEMLNQFDSVKATAQLFFATLDQGYTNTAIAVLKLQQAWEIAKGNFGKADAIQQEIDAQKQYLQTIEDTKNAIIDEYSTSKSTVEQKKADIAAVKDATVQAENEKAKAIDATDAMLNKTIETGKKKVQEALDGIKQENDARETALQKQISDIAAAEQEGVVTHAQAVEQKIAAEQASADERLAIATKLADLSKALYGKDSEQYKAAKKELLDAELDYNKQVEAAAKQRIGLQKEAEKEAIQAAREAAEEKKALEEAVSATREAELDRQIALIEAKEQEGVISHAEAVRQKLEAEKAWLESKVSETKAAMDAAAAEYGRDSAEYQKAVAAKIQADTALIQNATAAASAKVEMSVDTTRATANISDLESKAKQTFAVVSSPIQMDIDTSPAQAALRSLAEEAKQTAAQYYKLYQQTSESAAAMSGVARQAKTNMYKLYREAEAEWHRYQSKIKKSPAKATTEFRAKASPEGPFSEVLARVQKKMTDFRKDTTTPLSMNLSNISNAAGAVATKAAAASGISGLKDMGKMEVKLGGKAGDIIGKPDVLKWLKEALTDEKRMGYT